MIQRMVVVTTWAVLLLLLVSCGESQDQPTKAQLQQDLGALFYNEKNVLMNFEVVTASTRPRKGNPQAVCTLEVIVDLENPTATANTPHGEAPTDKKVLLKVQYNQYPEGWKFAGETAPRKGTVKK